MRRQGLTGASRGKVSIRYIERLAEAAIEPMDSSKGDSYNNALAETINGMYKAEVTRRREPWKTKQAEELATLEWLSFLVQRSPADGTPGLPAAARVRGTLSSTTLWSGRDRQAWTNGPARFPGRFRNSQVQNVKQQAHASLCTERGLLTTSLLYEVNDHARLPLERQTSAVPHH